MKGWLLSGVIVLVAAVAAGAEDAGLFNDLEGTEVSDGETIRLLGVFPAALPEEIKHGSFRVLSPKDGRTRYGEVLAHVIMADGAWLQNSLVSEGRAIVMPVYERDDQRLQVLLAAEDAAREAKVGLWRKSPVVCADNAKRAFDTFAIIQGRITEAADVRGTIYLNFGDDYRKDFTIKFTSSSFKRLPEETRAQITRLTEGMETDTMVEARGWVFYSGGPMIEVKTPVQIRFLDQPFGLQEERCGS